MFLQVLVIDELSIPCGDMQKIEDGEIKATLTWLAQNTAMTLASLSSTSILDRNSREVAGVSQTVLDELTMETKFEAVNLNHIMRSSQNIAEATSPESVNLTRPDSYQIKTAISPGSSSTVSGTRPKAMIYKFSKLYKTPEDVDYSKLSEFVSKHLATLPPSIKVVVICDMVISARQLSNQLRQMNTPVTCYHGGVELFSYADGTPDYREDYGWWMFGWWVAHVTLVSALGSNPSFFLFWGTFIQLGGLLGQGLGLGLGPGLDHISFLFLRLHFMNTLRLTPASSRLATSCISQSPAASPPASTSSATCEQYFNLCNECLDNKDYLE